MPYPPEHKVRTRRRIVGAASRLFRRRGFRATSVDELMGEAGFTRGGFYAHFRSKAKLLEAALEAAFAESEANLLERGLEELRGERWLERAAARYLSSEHVARPEQGCAIPALGAEVARDASARTAFERPLSHLIDALAERLGGEPAAARARVIRHLATWVGALTIARAVADPALREEILEACRATES